MKTIFQSKNSKQDRGNYKIVTGKFLTYSPLRGEAKPNISVVNVMRVENERKGKLKKEMIV